MINNSFFEKSNMVKEPFKKGFKSSGNEKQVKNE